MQSRTKTLIKTKLLEGKYLEVRSYELNKQPLRIIYCRSTDYKSCYHLGEEFQELSLAQQLKGKITNTQQSKFPPYSYYKLLKFLWKPKGKTETEQFTDKNIQWDNKTGTARIGVDIA